MLFALFIILKEISVHSIAAGLARNVPQELDGLNEAWNQYDALSERSLRIGTRPLERALIPQTAVLTDRTFARYRTATVVVRENQWRAARTALASALRADPSDRSLKGALLYCEGHLRRIDGEARSKAKDTDAARQQLTAAVTAFRQAAELRQNWPDPFLGLMRTFVALDDMERGADALAQAQRYAYTAGESRLGAARRRLLFARGETLGHGRPGLADPCGGRLQPCHRCLLEGRRHPDRRSEIARRPAPPAPGPGSHRPGGSAVRRYDRHDDVGCADQVSPIVSRPR